MEEYKSQQAGGQEAEVVVFFGTLIEYAYVDNELYGFFAVVLDAWIHNLCSWLLEDIHIRKKGVGPRETQVALGVSRDSKDLKDH